MSSDMISLSMIRTARDGRALPVSMSMDDFDRLLTVPSEQPETLLERLYDVEFNASLKLQEQLNPDGEIDGSALRTAVLWDLDLNVWIQIPGVIALLPEALVQTSGDHLLRQIVRQISRRLTWKVQEDFHASHGLQCPPRRRAQF